MCLICVEFQKGKLTVEEGWKNLSEMEDTISEEHKEEVEEMLWDGWTVAQDKNFVVPEPEEASGVDFDIDEWYWEHGQGD